MSEAQTNGADVAPINIQAQYIRDLSFENPNPIESLLPSEQQPQISVDIQVSTQILHENIFEVVLALKVNAQRDGKTMFLAELDYAGIVSLNVSEDLVNQVLLISVPQLLFPYARQIISETIANGGFPPLMLTPVDFVGLYQQQAAVEEAAPAKTAVN